MARETAQLQPTGSLSADIRLLGNLLGAVIREQHGEDAFALVEEIRAMAKARRQSAGRSGGADQDSGGRAELFATISGLDLESKRILIKAFSNYFQLINIAEDGQRIRVLRHRESRGVLDESIDAAIATLRAAGLDDARVRAILDSLSVRLVLTAHPSEAKRKEILLKLRKIAGALAFRSRQAVLLERERREIERALAEEIEELWQTRPTRSFRARVADEVDHGLYFVTSTIMDLVAGIYADLRASLEQHYPDSDWSQLPPLLRFASWIGGDRDGNPNVTAEATLQTIETQRRVAKEVYLGEVAFLRDHLTQSFHEIGASPALLEKVESAAGSPSRNPDQFYTRYVDLIRAKLDGDGYRSGEDFLNDLRVIDQSLRENRGKRVAEGTLQKLMRKVKVFGLHLLPVEIREDARRHAAALAEMFRRYAQCENYLDLGEEEKQRVLTAEIANPRPFFPADAVFSGAANEVISTWRMIAAAHRKHGKAIIDTVIGSMTQAPSDVLAMLMLATEAGVANDVDIVPLFETIDDLQSSAEILATLFANQEYRAHLAARGDRQQVMIGYSDSNLDGGYLASNWALYTAQEKIAEACRERGIELELFHGRGGSIGRGGGPANRAILSQPAFSMRGRIKMTEQGEVIADRYGNPEIGRRHLHQVMHAVLLALGAPPVSEVRSEWRSAMDQLAESGQKAYRAFVHGNPRFLEYWREATPIEELASLPIGSRPARRPEGGFGGVRAIPWVFSWMQSRAIIPSWYGLGRAMESFCQANPGGLSTLREMYDRWPFFNTLVENAQLDVAKADMGIAGLYASLVTDAGLRDSIFSEMKTEHARACRQICRITRQTEILSNSPVMQRSIERRNPYVDPLNFIQVALLREVRQLQAGTPAYEPALSALLFTVNGIAAGMKTTG